MMLYLDIGGYVGKNENQSTDEFLAIRFPLIRKSWLERISRKLGLLKQENGGHAEMRVQWKHGTVHWTEWLTRDYSQEK